ncbi:hypothetical protein JHK84_034750 [Glycine max]|nr:hypothetical protein JHK84_034750 [Glycine max]
MEDDWVLTPSTGFGIGSAGQHQNQKAYGLALCRGDVLAAECKTCVSEAPKEILSRCPYNKGGIIWYDYCMFRYLDTDFLGKIDNTNKFYMWNLKNVSDPATFNYKTRELLSQLAQKTYVMNNKLYATGELTLFNMSAQGLRASQLVVPLKIIILKLIYNPYSSGFVAASMGHFEDQRTYDLALCRGDNVLASECKTYVSDATKEIRNRCPYNKGATIWYDYYMFKYLDTTDFTGKVDNTIKIYMWNVNSVSRDPPTFNSNIRELLSQLA